MKTKLILCPIVILLGIGMLCPSAMQGITAEDIVSQLEQREQGIKSIRGKFSVWAQILMNDGNMVELEKQYDWVKKGAIQKLTSEFKLIPARFKQNEPNKGCEGCPNKMTARIMTEKEIRTFNGQVTKRFLPESNTASISSGSQMFFLGKVPADWLLPRIKEKPLSAFLKQDRTLRYAGDVNLEGQICHLLEFTKSNTNGKLYLTDKQGGLVPVKYEDYIINHTLPFNTRVEDIFSEFRRYGDITMPTKVTVSVFRVYPDKEQLEMKEIFTVEQLDVNVQIPDADLLMQFPAGTHVHDLVSGTDYVVR